jgi:hypothetical protein
MCKNHHYKKRVLAVHLYSNAKTNSHGKLNRVSGGPCKLLWKKILATYVFVYKY